MSFVLALSCGAAMWPAHVRPGMDICRREEWMHGVSQTLSPPKFPWSHSSPGCRVGPSTASAALCGLLGVHSPLWPREDSRFIVLPQQASLPGSCFVLLDSVLSPEVRVQKVGGLGDSSTGCSTPELGSPGLCAEQSGWSCLSTGCGWAPAGGSSGQRGQGCGLDWLEPSILIWMVRLPLGMATLN